jgi:hypothetical protein
MSFIVGWIQTSSHNDKIYPVSHTTAEIEFEKQRHGNLNNRIPKVSKIVVNYPKKGWKYFGYVTNCQPNGPNSFLFTVQVSTERPLYFSSKTKLCRHLGWNDCDNIRWGMTKH